MKIILLILIALASSCLSKEKELMLSRCESALAKFELIEGIPQVLTANIKGLTMSAGHLKSYLDANDTKLTDMVNSAAENLDLLEKRIEPTIRCTGQLDDDVASSFDIKYKYDTAKLLAKADELLVNIPKMITTIYKVQEYQPEVSRARQELDHYVQTAVDDSDARVKQVVTTLAKMFPLFEKELDCLLGVIH